MNLFCIRTNLTLVDEVALSLSSADGGRAQFNPFIFSRLAVTVSTTVDSKTPAGVQSHIPFAALFSISADCVLALVDHSSTKTIKTQYFQCFP